MLIHHVAQRVDRHQRGDDQLPARQPPAAQRHRGAAEAGLGGAARAEGLADAAPRPRADVALGHGRVGGGQAGGIAHIGIRVRRRAAHAQVKEDRGRDDGHADRPGLEPDVALPEVAHGAVGRSQPERAPPGEHDGVDLLHQVHGPQQVGLPRSGRAAPLVHPADRASPVAQHDRAARHADGVGRVADPDARHRRERHVFSHADLRRYD